MRRNPCALGIALLACLISTVLAIPAAEPIAVSPCKPEHTYKDVRSGKPWKTKPQLAGGYQCTSDDVDTCNLGSTLSFSKGVSVSVSGGFSAGGLDLGKILTLGLSTNVGYSWSKTTAVGESAGVVCPAGKLTCGLQVVTSMITTKGQVCNTYSNKLCGKGSCYDFTVEAPELQGDGPTEALRTVMTFAACLVSCPDGSQKCEAASRAGLKPCPG